MSSTMLPRRWVSLESKFVICLNNFSFESDIFGVCKEDILHCRFLSYWYPLEHYRKEVVGAKWIPWYEAQLLWSEKNCHLSVRENPTSVLEERLWISIMQWIRANRLNFPSSMSCDGPFVDVSSVDVDTVFMQPVLHLLGWLCTHLCAATIDRHC